MTIFQGKQSNPAPSRTRAFTLIELLVVISIIGLLIAILLPVLGVARDAAAQSSRLSDMRQMMIGYTAHYTDNKDQVLYGKLPNAGTLDGRPISVQIAGYEIVGLVTARYPWRIAAYINGVWDILHSHTTTPPAPQPTESLIAVENKAYDISLGPGFGLNSIYVGGDVAGNGFQTIGSPLLGRYTPNRKQHVVFKSEEVRRPSELIVFADSKYVVPPLPGQDPPVGDVGNFLLTPPRLRGEEYWRANGSTLENLKPGFNIGFPEGYVTDATTTGFFDGSARTVSYEELSDMRLWANKADSADYDYTTQ
ncbi:MAG: prepilin-type N-terminal cleavage/methylation domain-containing protein [Planctomycetota bacterium]